MVKRRDYRALFFSIVGAALTWAGVTGLVLGPVGTAALLSLMGVIVGLDSVAFALWRTRYARTDRTHVESRSIRIRM